MPQWLTRFFQFVGKQFTSNLMIFETKETVNQIQYVELQHKQDIILCAINGVYNPVVRI